MSVVIIDDFVLQLAADYPSLMLDPRANTTTLYAQSLSPTPYTGENLFTFTKIDGVNNATVSQVASRNEWGSYGVADVDNDGNLYGQAPGTLTFTYQRFGKFAHDTMLLDTLATTNGITVWDNHVSGETRVDRVSTEAFVTQWRNADTTQSNLTTFGQDDMVVRYEVDRSLFGVVGVTGVQVRDGTYDDTGVLWVLVGDDSHTRIYKVATDGTTTLWGNLDSVFPGALQMMWVASTNQLLLGKPDVAIGLWLWDITTQLSVGTGLAIQWHGASKSFHNPKATGDSIWLPSVYFDDTVAVPPGNLQYFPQFTEVDVTDLSVLQVLQFPEIAAQFPVRGMNFYFIPTEALFSWEQNAIFAMEAGGFAVAKFIVGEPNFPPPPVTPPPGTFSGLYLLEHVEGLNLS